MTGPALADDLVLSVERLSTHFVFKRRTAKAVRDVSFDLPKGKTLAIVGESGSGKSVTSLSIMNLLEPPGRITSGHILFRHRDGTVSDLARASKAEMRALRGGQIAMIFQEPMTSLNPLFTIGDQISEMIQLHRPLSRREARASALEMLDLVEIPAAASRFHDHPHQMSGGMRQRVMIAMALACDPTVLIADEPTTALDVTIQAQILQLLRRLQDDLGMSILFITHDLGVVAEIADEVVVMYAGEVVEKAPVRALFHQPSHPYTSALLGSLPAGARGLGHDKARQRVEPIPGSVPSIFDIPPGCVFAPRCKFAEARCGDPVVTAESAPGHLTSCWKWAEVDDAA